MARSTDKYGIGVFEEVVDHLWKNRKLLDNPDYCFCDPDYAGLPDRIVRKLNSDAVDAIWWVFRLDNASQFTRKGQLEKALRSALFLLAEGRCP